MTYWINGSQCIGLLCLLALFSNFGASVNVQAANDQANNKPLGPFIGHVDQDTAVVWARATKAGTYVLEIRSVDDSRVRAKWISDADEANDFALRWVISDLKPDTAYTYRVVEGTSKISSDLGRFTSPAATNDPSKVRIAFGSCAAEDESSRNVWKQIARQNPTAFILGGDTPYIDKTTIDHQRNRYRAFATVPELADLLRTVPNWSTWDDHDFGKNDSDGTLKGKKNARKAFVEHRAQTQYGDGNEGIYTSFRHGPVEVFMIDARYFSWTGPSFIDPSKKTLLGKEQWVWLTEGLRKSDATFKLLITGMIWHDKTNREKDDWHTYAHERDALFEFIGNEKISGVVLIGGDVHCSRIFQHTAGVGYPMYEFVSSPVHGRTIASLNIDHPSVLRKALAPNTFLLIDVDSINTPATLKAQFLDVHGEPIFESLEVTAEDLSAKN